MADTYVDLNARIINPDGTLSEKTVDVSNNITAKIELSNVSVADTANLNTVGVKTISNPNALWSVAEGDLFCTSVFDYSAKSSDYVPVPAVITKGAIVGFAILKVPDTSDIGGPLEIIGSQGINELGATFNRTSSIIHINGVFSGNPVARSTFTGLLFNGLESVKDSLPGSGPFFCDFYAHNNIEKDLCYLFLLLRNSGGYKDA